MYRRFLVCLLLAVPPAAMAAESAPVFVLDDFEDGDRVAATGLSWTALSDAVMGGSSTMRLEVAGAKGARALRMSGSVSEKGFCGAWVALDREARAVDLRELRALRLRLRGEGAWRVGLRGSAGGRFDNFMAPVPGGTEWRTVEVPVAELRSLRAAAGAADGPAPALDLGEVRWLGLQTAADKTGDFALEVDSVELVGLSRPASPHGSAMTRRLTLTPASAVKNARWKPLGTDPAGDGKKAALADAVSLDWWEDGDVVWFRIGLAEPRAETFGLNLALDVDGDPANGQPWWGSNKAFRFDRLVTAWVHDTSGRTVEGTIGTASADSVMKGAMIDDALGTPRLVAEPKAREMIVGVPRAALAGTGPIRMVAAVGSQMGHNDDLPDSGAVTLAPKRAP